jgi:hypothetical protein
MYTIAAQLIASEEFKKLLAQLAKDNPEMSAHEILDALVASLVNNANVRSYVRSELNTNKL